MGNFRSDMRIKRISLAVVTMSFSLITLSGCGKETVQESYLSVDKTGKVTSVLYEEFDKDYYNVEDLQTMAENEIFSYNAEYDEPRIELTEVKLFEEEPYVKLSMNFENASDYAYYNQQTLFYGTIQEAEEAGYTISTSLVDDDGEKIDSSFIDEHQDRHIIITSDKLDVKTPYNIQYMSKGVTKLSKKEAVLSAVTTDNVQLLLSK